MSLMARIRCAPLRLALVVLSLGITAPNMAQQEPFVATQGDSVANVLISLQHLGLPLLFSTNIVPYELTIAETTGAATKLGLAREILRQHRLKIVVNGEFYLVARSNAKTGDREAVENGSAVNGKDTAAPQLIEQVLVTASLYRLYQNIEASAYHIDHSKLDLFPTIGEDAIRSLHHLPGISTQGISSQLRVRGSTTNDTRILINGHQLSQPFHVRDYQSLFSAIDPRIADPIRAYTGGYPVQYGDSLQGLILIESLRPEDYPVREIGLSTLTTSVLVSDSFGPTDDRHWLLSLRKGNLDWILDNELGEPRFYDAFLELETKLTDKTAIKFNGLFSHDEIFLSTERDPVETESTTSKTDNNNAWLTIDHGWNPAISSTTIFSFTSIDNERFGVNEQEDKLEAEVRDLRNTERFGVNHQWQWARGDSNLFTAGFDYARFDARYAYTAEAIYGDDYLLYEAISGDLERNLNVAIKGHTFGLYVNNTWSLLDDLGISAGLRYDSYSNNGHGENEQLLSPRIGINYQLGERSALSLNLGRYTQSHDPNLLQIQDGRESLNRAQSSDQFIIALQHNYSDSLSLRLEGYHTVVHKVHPRFENLQDPLALIPELEPDRTLLAPERARVQGVEFSLNYDGASPWSGWLTYVWSHAEDRINGDWRPRSWHQKHAMRAGLNYERNGWAVSSALHAHSGWPTTRLSIFQDPVTMESAITQDVYNNEKLNTFISLDFRLSRTFAIRRGELKAFLELTNVLNRSNACCVDYSPETNDDQLILDSDREFGLPRLPAIGFLWKF